MRPKTTTVIIVLLTLTLLAVLFGWRASAHGATTAPNSAPTASALRHRSEARHSAQVWHAERVRAANHRRSHARWVASEVRAHGAYWQSGFTTNTAPWRCIRLREEGMATSGNIFGILGEWGESFDVQATKAITIFRENGWRWGPTAWSTHTACGLP